MALHTHTAQEADSDQSRTLKVCSMLLLQFCSEACLAVSCTLHAACHSLRLPPIKFPTTASPPPPPPLNSLPPPLPAPPLRKFRPPASPPPPPPPRLFFSPPSPHAASPPPPPPPPPSSRLFSPESSLHAPFWPSKPLLFHPLPPACNHAGQPNLLLTTGVKNMQKCSCILFSMICSKCKTN